MCIQIYNEVNLNIFLQRMFLKLKHPAKERYEIVCFR